jgi:hypothetical protein
MKNKEPLKSRRIEKICLRSLAIVVLCILIAIYYFSIHGFLISEEWILFGGFYLLYKVFNISIAAESGMVKQYKPVWISVLVLVSLGAIPWIVFFPLLLSGTLTLLGFGSGFFL